MQCALVSELVANRADTEIVSYPPWTPARGAQSPMRVNPVFRKKESIPRIRFVFHHYKSTHITLKSQGYTRQALAYGISRILTKVPGYIYPVFYIRKPCHGLVAWRIRQGTSGVRGVPIVANLIAIPVATATGLGVGNHYAGYFYYRS